jgi:hypothetical protein
VGETSERSIIEVVAASYGQEGHPWADVTEAVRSILADGRIEVMIATNETFAIDPCPHVVKELRIRYRIGGGRVKEQRFGEGDRIVLP